MRLLTINTMLLVVLAASAAASSLSVTCQSSIFGVAPTDGRGGAGLLEASSQCGTLSDKYTVTNYDGSLFGRGQSGEADITATTSAMAAYGSVWVRAYGIGTFGSVNATATAEADDIFQFVNAPPEANAIIFDTAFIGDPAPPPPIADGYCNGYDFRPYCEADIYWNPTFTGGPVSVKLVARVDIETVFSERAYDYEFGDTGIAITGVYFAIHNSPLGGYMPVPNPSNLGYYASADYNLPGLTYLGVVPEPGTWLLTGLGLLAAIARVRRGARRG